MWSLSPMMRVAADERANCVPLRLVVEQCCVRWLEVVLAFDLVDEKITNPINSLLISHLCHCSFSPTRACCKRRSLAQDNRKFPSTTIEQLIQLRTKHNIKLPSYTYFQSKLEA